MFDAATAPVAAVQPDPHRAVPPRIGQVLGLVRTLIAYGKNLADTLRQHAAEPHLLPCFTFLATTFGTSDLALILARITRGLLRAAALEARLHRRAARGQDLKPAAIRLPSPRKPGAAKPATPPGRQVEDPSLAHLPTPEEILAKVRRRPIGAVLVDICLDLGIVPGQMDHATWEELRRDLILYGGNLATLLFRRGGKRRYADPGSDPRRVGRKSEAHSATGDSPSPNPGDGLSFNPIPLTGPPIFPPWPAPFPQSPAPACTGPPWTGRPDHPACPGLDPGASRTGAGPQPTPPSQFGL